MSRDPGGVKSASWPRRVDLGVAVFSRGKDPRTDGCVWRFSGFAYRFLSLELALDDFDATAPSPEERTKNWLWDVPRLRTLMNECAQSARASDNTEIVERTDEVLWMLDLWEEYLKFRREMISQYSGRSTNSKESTR
jgi:hypothetical protein